MKSKKSDRNIGFYSQVSINPIERNQN